MRMKTTAPAMGFFLILLGLAALARSPANSQAGAQAQEWVCPPCGRECDQALLDRAGNCSGCGMKLVEESSILSVAVLLFEGVDLLSCVGPAGIFSASKKARVFTVADSTDPLPTAELGELVPMRGFDVTPHPDVLIIPSGYGVMDVADDELVMAWVVPAAEQASRVLAVGTGGLLLAKGGLLAGHEMTTFPWLAGSAAELFEGIGVHSDRALVTSGKFTTTREAGYALEATLLMLPELFDEETASRVADRLGLAWPPRSSSETEK